MRNEVAGQGQKGPPLPAKGDLAFGQGEGLWGLGFQGGFGISCLGLRVVGFRTQGFGGLKI